MNRIQDAADFVKGKMPAGFKPESALVLGSGWSGVLKYAEILNCTSYAKVPGMAASSVEGHHGELILARLSGKDILIFSGRLHYYEGHSMDQVVFPERLASRLGAKDLVLTAAVGAANPKLKVGDVVAVSGHLNFMGANPLIGAGGTAFGERFLDLTDCYSPLLRKKALNCAKNLKIRAFSGVYCATSGPSYETPAEVRAFRKLGADVVGMSVVPEAVAARQMGSEVLALALVSNMASGVSSRRPNHLEVLEAGKKAAPKLAKLLSEIFKNN